MAWFPPRRELFSSLAPRDPEHPQPWSIKPYSDRHGGTEYVILDAKGSYVAEATEKCIAEAIAAGKPADALLKPEESAAEAVKRLEAELVKAKDKERKEANLAYQLKLGLHSKKCSGGDAGPDHIWLCDEISVHSDSRNPWSPRTESGKYHCACGAKMSLSR